MISYIDFVHIDWVTADLEQEATRKGLAHLRGVHVSSVARAARRRFSESTATLRSETLGLIPSRAESRSAQSESGRCRGQYSRSLRKLSDSPPWVTACRHSESKSDRHWLRVDHGCALCLHGLPDWQRLQRRLLFYDLPAGGVPLREQCSVQPVSPGHSHCGATQQAYWRGGRWLRRCRGMGWPTATLLGKFGRVISSLDALGEWYHALTSKTLIIWRNFIYQRTHDIDAL